MNIEKHLKPSFIYQKDLAKIYEPFFKKSYLSYMGYNRYYEKQKWCGLYSNAELVGSVLKQGYRPIFNSKNGFIISDGSYFASDAKDILVSTAANENKIIKFFRQEETPKASKLKNQGLYFFRSNLYYRESFFFSTDENVACLRSYYFDLIPELKIFCSHFLYQAREAISYAEQHKDNLGPIIQQKNKEYCMQQATVQAMLKKTKYCAPSMLGDVFLSNQERVCLYYLSRGFTYPEIAHEMQLQKRTVENYINNIKNKTNCNSRADLVSLEKHLAFFSFNHFNLIKLSH